MHQLQNNQIGLAATAMANALTGNAASKEAFMPAAYFTEALRKAGHANPTAWEEGLDAGSSTEEKVEHRIFHTNRAIRLYLSEQTHLENNMQARQLLTDGIDENAWCALINRGVVPWLMGTLPVKANAIAQAAASVAKFNPVTITPNEPVAEVAGEQAVEQAVQEPSQV